MNYIENPPNTWSLHLQVHDDLLLLVHGRDMFSQPEMADERNYYKPKAGRHDDHATPQTRNWSAGMAVFDISEPAAPRQIGFMPVEGTGLHRIWYVGGRWAYASAMMEGFSDYILVTIDMADPTKPAIVGRYWLPGMNLAAGEAANWPLPTGRYGLHHAVVQDDVAYCAWRDACLVVVDVKDKSDPKLVVHKNWAPPFGGGTHNCLPLPDRNLLIVLDEAVLDEKQDGFKPIWVFDNQVKSNPISVATFPSRASATISRSAAISARTTSTKPAGVLRQLGVDLRDLSERRRQGLRHPRPASPYGSRSMRAPGAEKLIDPRPNRPVVLHSADVFVDANGLCYCTDWSGAGLYIMEYTG